MTSYYSKSKLLSKNSLLVFTLVLIISIPILAQTPKTQAATPNSDLQEKAMSFLRDGIQLDMSKYTFTLDDKYTESEHLFYKMNLKNAGLFSNYGDAVFSFYDGVLGHCGLYAGSGGLIYLHPEQTSFNATLGIVERYQTWTNDSQVQEMADLLRQVGSEKNATEVSGNLTLRISAQPYAQYSFYNTFNGADYTGLTIFWGGTIDLDVSDSRVYEKIGDTSINISKEQAINIATDAVKNYSYNFTFGNNTTILVSNLTVIGVYKVALQTDLREDSTLFPYWNIQLNTTTPQVPRPQGIGVTIWANDGNVSSVYHWADADFSSLIDALFFFPIYSSFLLALIFAVIFAFSLIIVLVFVFGKSNSNADGKKS